MRAEIVHVTDHALLRWRQRAATSLGEGVESIISAVKQSRVLKRKEPLPYPMPRLPNAVYSVKDKILFVMESVTISEYRLVTVITEGMNYGVSMNKSRQISTYLAKDRRATLVRDKARLEKELSKLPKHGLPIQKEQRLKLVREMRRLEQELHEIRHPTPTVLVEPNIPPRPRRRWISPSTWDWSLTCKEVA